MEIGGTEEKAVQNLGTALEMDMYIFEEGEEDEKEEGILVALGSTGFLTQEEEPGVTTLVDAHNGSNNLIRLGMLWTVQH